MPGPVDSLIARFADDWALVSAAADTATIHGDLHPGNVLIDETGSLLLIGMHPIVVPWVFDAAWFEAHHLYNEPTLPRLPLIEAMERARIDLGLSPIRRDHAATCAIVRGWHAAELWLKQDDARRADAVRQNAVIRVVEAATRA
jgi:aminoglycoside phosphotransferase (APT) family kinase protein